MNLGQVRQLFSKISLITVVMWAIIGIPFLLGKYCEIGTPAPFDSGAYVYSAENILRGAVIGVDEMPSAKVGTLLINLLGVKIFGFSDLGPKVMQGVLQLAALIIMFLGLKKHYGRFAVFISTLIASIYISAPFIAKYGNVKEQFMTAFIGIAIGSFMLYYGDGKKIWAIVCGFSIAAALCFKETGISITAAMVVFLLASLVLKWQEPKCILRNIILLVCGMAILLVPLHTWLTVKNIPMNGPYNFVIPYITKTLKPIISSQKTETGEASPKKKELDYVQRSREQRSLSQQAPVVLRYYKALSLPILLAFLSFIAAKYRAFADIFLKNKPKIEPADRIVFLALTCWLLDMLFVWISPRSYEQYYIPLSLSGAASGGYIIWLYIRSAMSKQANTRALWLACGGSAIFVMMFMSWNVFAGFSRTFHSGQEYGNGIRRKGFAQSLQQVADRKAGRLAPWEVASEYIKRNSSEDDVIFVWGWFPGIYVQSQRLSCVKKPSYSEMHVQSPELLGKLIREIVAEFEQSKPLFIVDSRKRHFPWDRPPLELMPSTPNGFLPANEMAVSSYERQYYKILADQIDQQEAKRFEAMSPLRKYIRENYIVVDKNNYKFSRQGIGHPQLGEHVIFKRKD